MTASNPAVLKCANLQDGIDFEIERERIGMRIAERIAMMNKAGRLFSPSDEDLAELRRLEALRGNGPKRG